MGNICGGFAKDRVAEDFRASSPGTTMTSKTSGSITTTSQSTTGKLSSVGSSFMASSSSLSTSDGFDEGAKYPDGQILEAPNLRTFTFMELKTATKNFRPDSVLGEGGFETIYKGWVDEKIMTPTRNGTGMVVAVQKLNSESMQGYEEWQDKHYTKRPCILEDETGNITFDKTGQPPASYYSLTLKSNDMIDVQVGSWHSPSSTCGRRHTRPRARPRCCCRCHLYACPPCASMARACPTCWCAKNGSVCVNFL